MIEGTNPTMPRPFDIPKLTDIGCTVERQLSERITVVGPAEHARTAESATKAAGFHTIWCDHYTDSTMHPEMDPTRFRLDAERKIDMGD